ncbi:NlpC/P60 family protein [Utexia brackfieldae]|uniref:NlpC/P60 family protein n=1 Tax=Utexia brackfieldae TaxID=3074108 RepID=UPI00370D8552
MSIDEFISKTIGIKWVDRACSWDAMDCWGLVIMYYKHVLDVLLPDVVGYQNYQTDIQRGTQGQINSGKWIQIDEPVNHCVFVGYLNGEPSHVGVCVDRHVIHANGSHQGGQVQYNRLDAISKCYQNLEFFKYVNLSE